MKKLFLRTAILTVILTTSCTTMTQMASLLTCNYNIQGIANPRLAGVGVSSTGDLTKLDMMTAARVATSLLSGSLPLSATVNVGVTNPNGTAAQVAGLDWALFLENTSMVSGSTQQQVYVAPNGGRSVVPLTVEVDLAQLFRKESKEDMLKFANGLMHIGESSSKVSLKIRPSVSFGGQVFKTGFITVSKAI